MFGFTHTASAGAGLTDTDWYLPFSNPSIDAGLVDFVLPDAATIKQIIVVPWEPGDAFDQEAEAASTIFSVIIAGDLVAQKTYSGSHYENINADVFNIDKVVLQGTIIEVITQTISDIDPVTNQFRISITGQWLRDL